MTLSSLTTSSLFNLLVPRAKSDKSAYLARAGFTSASYDKLRSAIRKLVAETAGIADRADEYGTFCRVEGELIGEGGVALLVKDYLAAARSRWQISAHPA